MPLYEYRCPECGTRFEEIRALRQADEEVECPVCGSGAPRRQLSSFATASGGRSPGGGSASCGPTGGRGFT